MNITLILEDGTQYAGVLAVVTPEVPVAPVEAPVEPTVEPVATDTPVEPNV